MTDSLLRNLLYRFSSRVKVIRKIFSFKNDFMQIFSFFNAMKPINWCCHCSMKFQKRIPKLHAYAEGVPEASAKKLILICGDWERHYISRIRFLGMNIVLWESDKALPCVLERPTGLLAVFLSMWLSGSLFVRLSICLPFCICLLCLSVFLFVSVFCLYVYQSVCLSVCLSVHLSVHLFLNTPLFKASSTSGKALGQAQGPLLAMFT